MDPETMYILRIIGWLVLSAVIGGWSQSKGRGFWYGFLFSIFLSPIIGAIIVGFSSRRN